MSNSVTTSELNVPVTVSSIGSLAFTVTGVDKAGQLFRERIVAHFFDMKNCVYDSNHEVDTTRYLLLEIRDPLSGQKSEQMRARAKSLRSSGTLRKTFQVTVELENPIGEEVLSNGGPPISGVALPVPHAPVSNSDPRAHQPAIDPQPQTRNVVREAISSAVAIEISRISEEFQANLARTAEKAVQNAAESYLDRAARTAIEKELGERDFANFEALREKCNRDMEAHVSELGQHLVAQLVEAGEDFRESFAKQMNGDAATAGTKISGLVRNLNDLVTELRAESNSAQAHLQELERAVEKSSQGKIATARQTTLAESELAAWELRFKTQAQTSIENTIETVSQHLERESRAAVEKTESIVLGSVQTLEKLCGKATEQSQHQIHTAVAQVETEVQAIVGTRSAEFQRRLESLVEGRAAGLASEVNQLLNPNLERATVILGQLSAAKEQAEHIVHESVNTLQKLCEEAESQSQQRLGRLLEGRAASVVAEVAQLLNAHLERARVTLGNLAVGREQAEAVSLRQVQRAEEIAEQSLCDFCERVEQTASLFRADFEQASRAVHSRSLEEIQAKSRDLAGQLSQDLEKASGLYQEKAQTQMQTALESMLDQANTSLRDKAGEISRILISEIDRTGRAQLEGISKDAVGRAHGQMCDAAANLSARFTEEFKGVSHRQFESLVADTRLHLEEIKTRMHSLSEDTVAAVQKVSENAGYHAAQAVGLSLVEFQKLLSVQMERDIARGRLDLEGCLIPIAKTLGEDTETAHRVWLENINKLTRENIDLYKQKLENISNTWTVASAASLSQNSVKALDAVTQAAEQRLKETMNKALADFEASMKVARERLGVPASSKPVATSANESDSSDAATIMAQAQRRLLDTSAASMNRFAEKSVPSSAAAPSEPIERIPSSLADPVASAEKNSVLKKIVDLFSGHSGAE